MLCIDFETESIIGNPIHRPPQPVGVSIKQDGAPSRYLAWGHPTENNCTYEFARAELLNSLAATDEWLAHNAAFECAVLRDYFGYVPPTPLAAHDTQYLIFLTDPYAFSYSLKPSAERILGIAPTEQDELRAWILAHVSGAKVSDWAAHISKAPGALVGRYAAGDTDRTYGLYQALHPQIVNLGMLAAYQREQYLMPVLSDSSRRGVRVDVERLAADTRVYLDAKRAAEDYIHGRLGSFNIDSDSELADALDRASMVTEWVLTPTGKRSTARKNLLGRVRDPELLHYLAYRGVLATCLGTFAGPWLEQAARDGRLHAQWNQIRGNATDKDITGTRTGRLSCKEPNLTNIPNDFDGLVIPKAIETFIRLRDAFMPLVPHMRRYLLPEEGHVWLKRDFAAQEMRIMAHYAEGKLFDAFRRDPDTDPHQAVKEMIDSMRGGDMDRKYVKITGFGIMYGRGIPNLSAALGVDEDKGREIRDAYYSAMPEVRELSNACRQRGRIGQYIRTWGGRVYYKEPHPTRDLSYKLLNFLCQSSAADQTKQCIIDYDKERAVEHCFLAAVHDELNISVPVEQADTGMGILRGVMNRDRFDVPFRSDGFSGPNWSELTKCL